MLRDGVDSTKIVLNLEVAQAHKNFRLPLNNVGCLEQTNDFVTTRLRQIKILNSFYNIRRKFRGPNVSFFSQPGL